MDIPKTRQYDTGKIEVVARSSVGEAMASTELTVVPRSDDYRGVLKNSPRRKCKKTTFLLLKASIKHKIHITMLHTKRKKKGIIDITLFQ